MLHKIIVLTAGLALSLGFVNLAAAAEESVKPATVVIYRADEHITTGRINFDVHVDESSLGRLNEEGALVVEGAPGTYTLGSSIADTQPLVLDLKPGQTHYIHAETKMLGNRVYVDMVEVEEQTARVHQPDLDDMI
jgi:hypothetical protein